MLANLHLNRNCGLLHRRKLTLLLLLLASSVMAAENEFSPYVGVSVVKDDNLYRLDSDAVLPSALSKEDTLYRTTFGVAVDWTLSRQRFLLDLSANDNRFDKNTNLDYAGQALDAKWNWLFGSNLTGEVGVLQKSTLSDFSNNRTQRSSKKEDRTAYFSAKWQYAPEWEVGVKLSDYDLNYDLTELQVSDRKTLKKSIFWNYITHAGNRLGLTFVQEDGEYPNRDLSDSSFIDNEYQQNTVLFNVEWLPTGKSKLSAGIGWNARVHPNLSDRDSDGFNTNVSYAWFPTGKTAIDVSLYRQLQSSNYVDATYSENTGYSLGLLWRMSEKIAFNGLIKSELKDFVGQVDDFKERYDSLVIGLTYQPDPMLGVSLKFNQSARDSDRALRDYESQSIVLDFIIEF